MTLAEFLKEKDFPECPIDGEWHAFDRTKPGSGRFRGVEDSSGTFIRLWDWASGEKYSYRSMDHEELTREEKEEREKAFKKAQKERDIQEQIEQERVAGDCKLRWETCFTDRGQSPYLERKGLPGSLYGSRLQSTPRGVLTCLAAVDCEGKVWGIQEIDPVKLEGKRDKHFAKGMRVRGCYHLVGALDPQGELYVAEGFATAVSVHLATGKPTVCSFNAGNLVPVCLSLKQKWPALQITIAADDDRWSKRPDGTPFNGGRTYGTEAARLTQGKLVFPVFTADWQSDFNDIHSTSGLAAVGEQLEKACEQAPAEDQSIDTPEPREKPKKQQKKGPHFERRASQWLLDQCGDDIIRQDKSLFIYDGKKWRELGEPELDGLRNRINRFFGDGLSSRDVAGCFKTFFRYVPVVPEGVNFFTPNPSCANFSDGTLHLTRDTGSGVYALDFQPHRREDYLTWSLPVEYRGDRAVKNELFLALLEEAFEGDPDKSAKIESLGDCAGSMLVPGFPQLFFLHGVSGSRKSTLAKCLLKTLSMDNISWVDPTLMEGFQVEGMIGKLVNANTDIEDHAPLPRGFLKRFEDRLPYQVNRKGKMVVNTVLPAVHIYCANKLPPNFEGSSKALHRRVTLLEFGRDLTNDYQSKEIRYYEDLVYTHSARGLLNFHLDGLERLVSRGGKFIRPESSTQKLISWQQEQDSIGSFLRDLLKGEIVVNNTQLRVGPTWRIKTTQAWEVFKVFHLESWSRAPKFSKFKFYAELQKAGFNRIPLDGYEHFAGFGVTEVGNAKF